MPQKWVSNIEVMDSLMRPYANMLTEHENNYATIVLLQEGQVKADDDQPANYLDGSFDSYISELTPDPNASDSIQAQTLREGGSVVVDSLDGINPYYGIFSNFSLQNVTEKSDQIVKIHQNFSGYWNAFFFGEQPRVFQFSGVFIDTKEYPYFQEFMVAYDKWLSGRKCIENKMTMKMIYDGRLIDGYIISVGSISTAENPMIKQFQFQVLVRASAWIRSNIIAVRQANSNIYSYKEMVNALSNPNRLKHNSLTELFNMSSVDKQQHADEAATQ